MKSMIFKYLSACMTGAVLILAQSCTQEPSLSAPEPGAHGAPLTLAVSFGEGTRLAELPGGDAMGSGVAPDGKDYGLKNVGLYVYYTEDYKAGILFRPYVRNMECTVEDGMLKPLSSGSVYIYDEMTVVAFYPYNAAMSEEENYFDSVDDEENYPITMPDYADQFYIPYRAEVETNPTIAYYTVLQFVPKHTFKIEIVLVAKDPSLFPEGEVRLLPNIDPVGHDDLTTDYRRAEWYDAFWEEPDRGGGSYVQKYTGYIWTGTEIPNEIKKGEVLMQAGDYMLIASQDVDIHEEYVYRYGFNLSTGEIFIPTSSKLIHDQLSLEAVGGMSYDSGYQVCDIELTGAWTPLNIFNSRFDGGGHKITGLNVSGSSANAGLFGRVSGNSQVCNVYLVEPQIDVTNMADTVRVGALVGRLNMKLTEQERAALIANLPDDLSQVVKEAIIAQMLEGVFNSNSKVVVCRVDSPSINVTGLAPRVGTLVSEAGDINEDGFYHSFVWDCYTVDGSLSVNAGDPSANSSAYVGGFVGLNHGRIRRSLTTTEDITAFIEKTVDDNGTPVTVQEDIYSGFTNYEPYYQESSNSGVIDCYAVLADDDAATLGSGGWPAWAQYTDKWPIYNIGWLSSDANSYWYSNGAPPATLPYLQWERR